ncbi:Ig-like domain repeat protein [Terracidiphilus gabretensis]|uniref:Ig-like domain repeat protein n=1 Tax=Terracidiphilus gabretensis TaxID=1577687 RepID=UPI00071B3BF9|nr:Ig-like domain repeat protein [Terracidiphilus gabretensis]
MLRSRLVSLGAIATVLFASMLLKAQQSVVSPRIVAPIDESKLIALPGGVPLLARSEFDLGRASASTQMTSVRLVLSLSLQQEAALKKFMAEQLDPASPNYRKWLTPDQFGKLYGASDTDIQVLVTWLESQGFTVQPVPQGRVSISFSGSVSEIEAAFHTEIHSFRANEQEFLSNISAPRIPSALAPVVSGIAGLNTIKPRAHNASATSGTYDPKQKRFIPADSDASGPRPFLTIGSATSGYSFYVVPADAATIYNTPNSFNTSFSSGSSYTGSGVTIGIGGDAPIQAGTVASYRSQFLGNSTQITITTVGTAPTSTNDTDEAYIDTELSGGLAPGATINFYTAINLSDAINQAIEDNKVDIFSLSFGNCEANLTTADNQLINSWWQQAASQGIAVTVSTGDSGAAGCDNDNTEEVAQFGLQVNGFASTPFNIAVGGTDFSALLSNFGSYVSTSNGTYYESAVSYIPESTWNDSAVTDGLLAQNTPYENSKLQTDIGGGSGGASSCSTNANNATNTTIATCTSGYAKPSWQTGAGVPSDGVRDLPDISLFASNGFDGAAWLVCTDGTFTQNGVTYTTNCETQSGGGFSFTGYGGTSTSAPAFAGILALVQQKTGSRLGQAAKNLYGLYNGPNASAVFHDTTTGNISVPCNSGTPNCSKNTAGYYFLTGYNTTTGYDLATGLGSVNVTNLVNYWGAATGTNKATVSVTPGSSSITTSQSLTVTGSVTGTAGTSTGTVTLTSGTYTSTAATLNGSGNYSITVPAGSLIAGTDTLTVSYSGDSNYATATGTGSVTVAKATPALTVSPASTVVTGAITNLSVTITVNGGSVTPTGTVTLSATGGYSGSPCTLAAGACTFSVPVSSLPQGTVTLTSSYSGDSLFNSTSNTATITVNIYQPKISFTLPSNVTTTSTLQIPVTVTGVSGEPVPTGGVILSGYFGDYGDGVNLANGTATYSFAPGNFDGGTLTLSFAYSGDTYYRSTTVTGTMTVSKSAATLTIVPSSTAIQTNQALTVTGSISGGAGIPSIPGTVIISGGGYTSSAMTLLVTNGTYFVTIPANSLKAGADTLTATFSGDDFYNSATSSAAVTVTTPPTPTITVTPASSTVDSGQSLAVVINVAGISGLAAPTGTVILTAGSYTSSATSLSSGAANFTIPANSLSAGTDSISAAYSGDAVYLSASGSASVTVTASAFSLSSTTPSSVSPGTVTQATITVSSSTNYSGSISLSCSLTTSPTGAANGPSCSVTGSPVTLSSSTTSGTATVNFSTTAASAVPGQVARLGSGRPDPGKSGWTKAGAATLLAFLVFLGIPARRRAWRAVVGVLVLIAALGTLSACGGGSSSGGGGGGGSTGTTAGAYTFTVTATGTPAVSPAPTATITLTVN